MRTMLLEDIRTIFHESGITKLASKTLCERLTKIEDRPWPEWQARKGDLAKPLTPTGLSRLLRPFEIRPRSVRLSSGETPKGYAVEWFADAFKRYLPLTQVEQSEQVSKNKDLEDYPVGTQSEFVPTGKTEKPNENGQCSDCSNWAGDIGPEGHEHDTPGQPQREKFAL